MSSYKIRTEPEEIDDYLKLSGIYIAVVQIRDILNINEINAPSPFKGAAVISLWGTFMTCTYLAY
jgi:hypothetical protein